MRAMTIRTRTAAVISVTAVVVMGGTLAYGAASNPPTVDCPSSPCTITVTVPTQTVTTTVTGPTSTVTVTVTAPPSSATAPTTTQPATTAPATTAPPTSTPPAGCPVAGTNKPGASDGKGGCFPGPGNSGVPAGTTLTAYTGPMTITVANTVIDAKAITGRLYVNAAGVKITRSTISNGIENRGTDRFTLTDSKVLAATPDDKALDTEHFTALRNEIKGGNSGGWCSDCLLQDNWIHNDIVLASNDAHHLSAYRMDQNGTFTHNTLACESKPTSVGGGCSGNLTGYGDFQTVQNNLVNGNLFVASTNISYCTYGGGSGGKPYPNGNNVVIRDNVFQRGTNSKCGQYAPIGDFNAGAPGNAALNNVWDDGTTLPGQP